MASGGLRNGPRENMKWSQRIKKWSQGVNKLSQGIYEMVPRSPTKSRGSIL